MDNYGDLKNLQRNLVNDVTPSRTTTDILANLKLIGQARTLAGEDNSLGKIAKEELKYLDAAMHAISENPVLSQKFGSGLQGALDVSALLKDRYNTKVYETMLDSTLAGASTTTFLDVKPSDYVKGLNHGNDIA